MALMDHVKKLSGDSRQKARAFVDHLIHDINAAVAASDIFKVRDLAAEMSAHKDDIAAHLSGGSTAPAKEDDAKQPARAAAGR